MIQPFHSCGAVVVLLAGGLLLTGCGDSETASSDSTSQKSSDADAKHSEDQDATEVASTGSPRELPRLTLASTAGDVLDGGGVQNSVDNVLAAMKPLQALLGLWEGKTRKPIEGFSAVDAPRWVWDFQTHPEQPALVVQTKGNPYLTEGRMTFLVDEQKYRFESKDKEGDERVYEGTFIEQPRQEDVDGDTIPDQIYKLQLTQIVDESTNTIWQLVFNQQENNRYLMELYRKRGSADFARFDTVANQRENTSIAKSEDDYGERTCVITQGLGTAKVSHDGKTYWVCCSGCKAEFEAEPAKWIARFEKQMAAGK